MACDSLFAYLQCRQCKPGRNIQLYIHIPLTDLVTNNNCRPISGGK